jgi:hypothetical protein
LLRFGKTLTSKAEDPLGSGDDGDNDNDDNDEGYDDDSDDRGSSALLVSVLPNLSNRWFYAQTFPNIPY